MAKENLNIVKSEVFDHPQFGHLRTMTDDKGNPWFVGKVVAEVLGYKSAANAVAMHVETEDKGVTILMTPGGNQQVTLINESGLYSLILSSKLPQAREFKHWVTSEVLPQIRKTGGYIPVQQEDDEKTILCKALMIYKRTLEQKEALVAQAQQQLEEQKPMVQFAEAITASDGSILIGDLAKLITQNGHEIGRTRLFTYLRDKGYLFKTSTRPIQEWVEKGLFQIHETLISTHHGSKISVTTKVTPKGQEYFLRLFAK